MTLRSLAATIALAATLTPALACTAVDLVAADKSVIAGRTMEWAFDMKWALVSVPKGAELTLTAPRATGLPPKTVATLYSVVGVSAGIIPGGALLEGQNSVGLGMSGNFLPGFTEYQSVTPEDKNYVDILTFGSWVLGSFATVDEVRAALQSTKVWADGTLNSGPTPPTLHFIFTDRSGKGIVVEYVKGELQISDNVAHVLTNPPTYDWHINNARNYLNLTPVGPTERQIAGANVTALGQGGGMFGLPGDYTPPSRFIRAAALRAAVTQPANAAAGIQTVGHILNTVDIPIGAAQFRKADGSLGADYTQWVAIKDLTNNRLLIADYANRTNFLTIDLDAVFAAPTAVSTPVADLPYPAGAPVTSFARP